MMTALPNVQALIRVILVSSDGQFRTFVRDSLTTDCDRAFELHECDPGDPALVSTLSSGEHDVILFDAAGEQPDGAIYRNVLTNRSQYIPVIVLVDARDADKRERFQEAGAADVLLKSDLVAPLIRRALEFAAEYRQIEERLASLALFDEMTGLPSMTLFWEFLSYAVKRAHRQKERLALMGVYVNGLNEINETSGHDIGDRAITQIAKNIQSAVRSCDAVARYSGTKFLVLLEPLQEDENVHIISERVAQAVAKPVAVDGTPMHLTATIGVTLYPTSVASPSALLRNATAAMDYAMDRGAGSIHIV